VAEGKDDGGSGLTRPSSLLTVDTQLSLSILSLSDAMEIFKVVEENRIYLRKTLPWLDEVNTLDEQISYISHCISDYELHKGIMYSIKSDGDIIGTMGLNSIDYENMSCGVGYWVSEEFAGKGIATRCCSRLIDHCFNDLNLHRFVLEASVENIASCRVAEKLGLRLEGVTKDREWLYDRFLDANLYAVTKPEWDD
tara:strand:+ start:114150 stop:114737 length:588 start_codon:yes stop_codon:yes gene_type:complete